MSRLPAMPFMGGRDHSTVWHGVRKINRERVLFEPVLTRVMVLLGIAADNGQW